MIFYIILCLVIIIILTIVIWGAVTKWKFINQNKNYYEKSKNKPLLLVYIGGGLGNCLRPLLSTISFAKKFNYQIKLVNPKVGWYTHGGTGIKNIFNLKDISRMNDNELNNIRCHIFIQQERAKLRPNLKTMKKNCKSYNTNMKNFDKLLKKGEDIYFDSNSYIESKFVDSSLYPKIFKDILLPDIKQKALEIKKKLGLNKNIIACHIRATDRGNQDEKVKQIKEKIKNNPQQQFFVCSDEKKYEDSLLTLPNVQIFSKMSYVKKKNRDKQSVLDAIIDLCCLSYCNTENNEYHTIPSSTFLEISRNISGWER